MKAVHLGADKISSSCSSLTKSVLEMSSSGLLLSGKMTMSKVKPLAA